MRLIDADALMKEGYCLERIYQKDSTTMVLEKRNIENVPIVDAVPVVRCRDREHYDKLYRTCEIWKHGVLSNGYCYRGDNGERRTE